MKIKSSLLALFLAVLFVAVICTASPITAVTGITGVDGSLPIVEGNTPVVSGEPLVATGGDVSIYYAGYAAADLDLLFNNSTLLVSNQTTPLGTMVNLGDFSAGTVITFELFNTDTGATYVTGPASLNPDDLDHAAYASWTANSAISANGTFVGMEDLPKGSSDYDYNDLMFVVSGVAQAPEPMTLGLMGVGLIGMGLWDRRRRKQRSIR